MQTVGAAIIRACRRRRRLRGACGAGTPKPAKDIWSILTKAGVPRYAELVCYSEDPGEAAANYFILRLMGFPDVKVLVG
jgi:3-mercaptopyruvate sulfurtransferase SseA